ncbi:MULTISPECIES: phage major capsid protein [unclassified Thermoanaerobacterium]|uniref:phage major capsid protein n=1 Tax=unclassified Thermoanaerobacterium TaxID=2622527 RepID=UPI000A149B6A|nr:MULTISPECIES: phage major capsid protein [unclassified Thermoanaerobacterium]MDE4542265.1 phage major capsid protein [Thermoanaerobacterium sp. R66]ORX22395.1 capsid protein [Thermoanaerobacterium sp. PSU-2]
MALKQIMLNKKIEQRKAALAELLKTEEDLNKRASELEKAIDEAKTDEEIAAIEEETEKLDKDKADFEENKSKLEGEIAELEGQLEELNSKEPKNNSESKANDRNKNMVEGEVRMRTGKFFNGMTREVVNALIAKDEVKEFLTRTRELIGQKRSVTGAELTIPDVMLDLLRDNLYRYSKLITRVNLKSVAGKARQNIAGTIPEGIWTESVGKLNELALKFNQIEVDGYKVGGFIPVPNSILEDSDLNLANEIMDALGQAIGLAVDKAILYGTGTKMPLGIATRLAQTQQPADWGANAPAWENLTTTNLLKLDGTLSDAKFFSALMLALGAAQPNYATGGTFWAMNRKTRMTLISKAVTFNAAGAIVAGQNNTMPVEGGDIVELPFIPDGDIIGGYGSLYLLAERAGAQLAVSDQVRFIEDQTVFKGTARYDGAPAIGAGFVIVNINNVAPTTTITFDADIANA